MGGINSCPIFSVFCLIMALGWVLLLEEENQFEKNSDILHE